MSPLIIRGGYTGVDRLNGLEEHTIFLITDAAMSGVGSHEFTSVGQADVNPLLTPQAKRLVDAIFIDCGARLVLVDRYYLLIEPGSLALMDEEFTLERFTTSVIALMRKHLDEADSASSPPR